MVIEEKYRVKIPDGGEERRIFSCVASLVDFIAQSKEEVSWPRLASCAFSLPASEFVSPLAIGSTKTMDRLITGAHAFHPVTLFDTPIKDELRRRGVPVFRRGRGARPRPRDLVAHRREWRRWRRAKLSAPARLDPARPHRPCDVEEGDRDERRGPR